MNYKIVAITDTQYYEENFSLKKLAAKVACAKALDDQTLHELLADPLLASSAQIEPLAQIIDRLKLAKKRQEHVLVCGDYDADGICATTIMVYALRRYGITCGYYIPNRFREGYGLSCNTVELAYEKGYQLLITVDNGVKAFAACERAQALQLDLILTDHHQYEELPPHLLFLHPAILPKRFSNMCGAAMALLIANALIGEQYDTMIWAMIATIGDVMPLEAENRMIVRKGLSYLRRGFAVPIQKLAAPFVKWDETAVAFQIVPKLNAIGRMADEANANMAVRYLLSGNMEEIEKCAQQIIALNAYRKVKSEEMYQRCMQLTLPQTQFQILYDPSFHEGLLGIAAGRIANELHVPTMVLTKKDDHISGSVRSVGSLDLMTFFAPWKDRFIRFGGHQKACAITIDAEQLPQLRAYCEQEIDPTLLQEEYDETLICLEPEEITLEAALDLMRLAPFGEGWKKPLFLVKLNDLTMTRLKGGHLKFNKGDLELIYFNAPQLDEAFFDQDDHAFVVSVAIKHYRGKQSVQLQIQDVISVSDGTSLLL
ncbi:DHH family phosphoesterase [Massilicoli timonensis]|uniref:Single-stranded-DNA-specific exonuclease RecJ n=1 Tax=Massilicoli timonensis TaxID=2015901 RepID=A0ABT1SJI1_9FIRM|nr:DHH family phosphoesterase [Massilicoli timonensis]MCQ5121382.1 DHH family phosphoesterase [Massilicoli timonensis]HIR16186.1 DHH family phosphoesterase [Candidatus Onthosoma merdavium]